MGSVSVFLLLAVVFLTPFSLAKPNIPDQAGALLQANSCQAGDSRFQNNDAFVGSAKNSFTESPELVFVQENSLIAGCPPNVITPEILGDLAGESEGNSASSRKEIIEYAVRQGDTLASLSDKFDISIETIAWANDLSKTSKLKPGQSLVILPVSGVLYYVKEKDNLASIAKMYKGDINEIIAFNELAMADDIYPGDILLIPGGIVPAKKPASTLPSSSSFVPIASGYFICPVASPCKVNQGLHWYNAVDLASKCGSPAYAAAGGTVLKAKNYGWNGGAGNYITILHSNGAITVYDHLQSISVSVGSQVSQGQIIGLTGTTGNSTGCHLHFEVRGAKNPF